MNFKSLVPGGRNHQMARRDFNNPFLSLQQEIDRLFDDFGRGFPSIGGARMAELTPAMDVKETDKAIEITAELPGLEEKDVEIDVSDNMLTLRGEKKAESEEQGQDFRMMERSYGSFYRSFTLPPGIDADKIQAKMSKGVLTLTLPKTPEAPRKKIEVKREG